MRHIVSAAALLAAAVTPAAAQAQAAYPTKNICIIVPSPTGGPSDIVARGHIRAGTLRALAVSTPQRNPSFPDVPTAAEAGVPGYDCASWGGMLAPAGTPRAIVQKLNAELGAALAQPDVAKRFNDMGLVVRDSTPEEFGRFIQSDMSRWRVVLTKK